MHSYLKINPR